METDFFIVPALYDQSTYFLFRDYAIEIKFTVIAGTIRIIGKGYLLPGEVTFIKENFA
ncbi:hypothetical protein [Flavobacterium caseinilyticum]|uniref:hypothetical protein n=1 Tax=Flavobacterium caseinilyticum TaxID=2541732 RepID=UPI001404981C|nr:hypothetical protein [Flavobacterium caseinilyticum]